MASRKPVTPITISDMKDRIIIRSLSLTTDGQGGQTETWATLATVWAYVKEIRVSERLYSQAVQYQRTHEIYIRYRTDVTADMSITYGSKVLQVKGTRNYDTRKTFLIIDCEENKGT